MKKLIITSIVFSLLVSCKKSKDKNCNLDTASLAGSYKVTSIKYKATSTSAETDYYNTLSACEKDDITTLNGNGTWITTDAGVKCSPPGDDSGTWSLSGNTITIDGASENIDNFNCVTLTLSVTGVLTPGDKITSVLTRQ